MTTQTTNEWQLPLDMIMKYHKGRIEGNEEHVPALLEAWTAGEGVVWCCWVGDTGNSNPRDCGLYAATVMASVTNCDYLLFSFDTHMSKSQVNPTTGKPWAPGEMQRMCDEEGYCDTGNIRDNLVVAIVRRSDAKIYFASIPYHFHKGDVMYFDPEPPISEWDAEDDGAQMGGTIPDGLREAVRKPVAEIPAELYAAFGFDSDDPESMRRARLHQILAGVRIMASASIDAGAKEPMFMHVIPTWNEEERDVLANSAKRGMSVQPLSEFREANATGG